MDPKDLKPEDVKLEEVRPYTMEELVKRVVAPHNKKSRDAVASDIERIKEEARVLHSLCFAPQGLYGGAYAMHHSQIDDQDPINFFVTAERNIIINPKITKTVRFYVDSKEACMTFFNEPMKTVKRFRKIEVEFITLMLDPEDSDKLIFSSPIQKTLKGREAFVYQHEFDHGQASYIYPFNKN